MNVACVARIGHSDEAEIAQNSAVLSSQIDSSTPEATVTSEECIRVWRQASE